jgi:hypothetical protein
MPFLIVALTSLLVAAIHAAPPAPAKTPAQSDSVAGAGVQHPQDKDDASESQQTPEEKAAQVAGQSYMLSLALSLSNSASPRDRAMATEVWGIVDVWDHRATASADRLRRGAILRAAAEAAPDDALVQWMWVHASPEDSGCNATRPCPHRLEAVALLQPDNGSAWVPLFNAAWMAKDVPAAESTLADMARSTNFDEQSGTALKAWMDIYQRYPVRRSVFVPRSDEDKFEEQTVEFTSSLAFAGAMAIQNLGELVNACRYEKNPDASPQRFRDCAQVGRLMMAHSSSLISRQIGRALLRVSGQATAEDIAKARVVEWQYEQWGNVIPADDDVEYLKAEASDWLDTSDEIKVLQREMQRKGIPLNPPAEWQPHGRDGKPISPLGEDPARS